MALQAVWRLIDNSNDFIGSNNGTDTDINYSDAGHLGKAASFNGSTSKIVIGNVFNLGTATNLTLSVWVKMNAANLYCEIITKNSYDVPGWRLLKYNADNKYYFSAGSSVSSLAFIDTDWHHIITQREISGSSDISRLFIDGVFVAENSSSICDLTNSQNLCIGCLHYSGGYLRFHNGLISDVKLDFSIWSPATIKNEFALAKGFF